MNFSNFYEVHCRLCVLIRGLQNLDKLSARTCKKLPVASFCASETAETGRIANGREQGDHVSRRQGGKGFNFVSGKLLFEWAESRFGKPRTSRKGTILFFSLVRKEPKVPQRFANLWTPGDDSNLRSIPDFRENDRRSSCNRLHRKAQPFRVSTVRI